MKSWEWRLVPLAQRLQNYIVDAATGCHVFQGRIDGKGYAQIKIDGKQVLVHRYLWVQKHGPLTRDQHVLHRCDNRPCVNMEHLFLGNHKKNMEDKVAKGRSGHVLRGAMHKRPMAKLNEAQVIEIKSLLARGYRQADISRDYGVSRNIICDIANGHSWAYLDGS